MNSRDVALVTAASLAGAVASFITFSYFFNPKRNQHRLFDDSSVNNDAEQKRSPQHDPFDPSKRQSYLSWDDYFMAIAFLSAQRSKDPRRQVGACLVNQNDVILGIGYNGFPRGCSDDKLPWAKKSKSGDPLETKYPYVCHAEVNAILNTNHASATGQVLRHLDLVVNGNLTASLVFLQAPANGRLYVTMFPCNECAKLIIQSGVSEVIYFIDKGKSSDVPYVASRKLLSMAGIRVKRHQPKMKQILIKFEEL